MSFLVILRRTKMNTKIAYEFLLVDSTYTVSSNNSSLANYEILRVNLLSIKAKDESNGVTFIFNFKDVIMESIYRIQIFIHRSEYKNTFNHVNWLRYIYKKLFDMYSISKGDLKELIRKSIKYMEEIK